MLKSILHIVSRARGMVAMSFIAIVFLHFSIPAMANQDWLTFTSNATSSLYVKFFAKPSAASPVDLRYSTDNGATWTKLDASKTFNLSVGESICFRGHNPQGFNKIMGGEGGGRSSIYFQASGNIEVSGDIMTLVDTTSNNVTMVPNEECFYRLFTDGKGLVSAKNLRLPKTTYSKCFYEMFSGCIGLKEGPDMSAIEKIRDNSCDGMFKNCSTLVAMPAMPNLKLVGVSGCHSMFQGCVKLTDVPDLTAPYIDDNAYENMFNGCIKLVNAPRIIADEMHNATCRFMYNGCTSLTNVPDLTALYIEDYCYEKMFYKCTALEKAPTIYASELSYTYSGKTYNYKSCFRAMFEGCSKLNSIQVFFTNWGASDGAPTEDWLKGVSNTTTGVFSAPCELPDQRGDSYIPSKWQFKDDHCFTYYTFNVESTGGCWENNMYDYNSRLLKSPITTLPIATKEGATFVEWNTQSDGKGSSWDNEHQPSVSTTYYAIFELNADTRDKFDDCYNYTDFSTTKIDTAWAYKDAHDANKFYWTEWETPTESLDYGPRRKRSRYSVHTNPAELDARTGGKLRTTYNGHPTVRLGNWENHTAERIKYSITVPEDKHLLLLHYAAVLEDPKHIAEQQPRFVLEILDNKGMSMGSCYNFDFKSGASLGDATWHIEDDICWKDWTTIGVNLQELAGKTITIQLTTYDCIRGGHYGYAYFALDCQTFNMKNLSCGDEEIAFEAPEGFDYRWYKEGTDPIADPTKVLSTSQTFVPTDVVHYNCDVINKENSDCYFTLTAVPEKRKPIAQFTIASQTTTIGGDKDIVTINNTSYIEKDGVASSDKCEAYSWIVTDSKGDTLHAMSSANETPTFEFTKSGIYNIHLTTGLNDWACISNPEAVQQVTVKHEGELIEEPVRDTVCGSAPYNWEGHSKYQNLIGVGPYRDTIISGIDTTVYVLTLTRQYPTTAPVETQSIMKGQTYTWHGRVLSEQGMYYDTLYYNKTNCDSAYLTLNLVIEQPKCHSYMANISVDSICANASAMRLMLQPIDGKALRYSITFDDNAKQQGFVDVPSTSIPAQNEIIVNMPQHTGDATWYVRPNDYSLTLNIEDTCGTPNSIVVPFTILYPSWLILQRWNDVLALYNQNYNGHYDFANIQWYHKGNNISGRGEHNSYIYTKDYGQETLEFGTPYWAELTRTDDGKTIRTCYCYPAYQQDGVVFSDQPNKVEVRHSPSDKRTLYIDTELSGRFEMYHVSGTHIASGEFDDTNKYIDAHDYMPGTYVIVFLGNDGTIEPKRIILD